VLITLDAREVRAEYDALESAYFSLLAEAQRHAAAILSADRESLAEVNWDDWIPVRVRTREADVLLADFNQIMAQLKAFDAAESQKDAERERLQSVVQSQRVLIETLQERVALRQKLSDSAVGTRTSLIDALETLHQQKTTLISQTGQLREAEEAIHSLTAERNKAKSAFIADNRSRAAEAKRNADELALKLDKARVRLESYELRSPIGGIVQALTVTSVGQVLPVAQEVMRIIPESDVLQAEVYVQNKDIGFVKEGQAAEVKVEAFPFTRYGVVHATVKRVARDAISQPEMSQTEADPARAFDGRMSGGAQRVHNLVYPVELTLAQNFIEIDGQRVLLMPGMSITAEVKTGKRRLIEYLLSPLSETVSQAARER
jgi:hemolysin D